MARCMLRERMTAAEKVANDPRIDISCLETVIGTRYCGYDFLLAAPLFRRALCLDHGR
jgi:hypothetical protein